MQVYDFVFTSSGRYAMVEPQALQVTIFSFGPSMMRAIDPPGARIRRYAGPGGPMVKRHDGAFDPVPERTDIAPMVFFGGMMLVLGFVLGMVASVESLPASVFEPPPPAAPLESIEPTSSASQFDLKACQSVCVGEVSWVHRRNDGTLTCRCR
jgi:hypothetical protein